MPEFKFLSRDENGRLQINNIEWSIFRDIFLQGAKNQRELEFIGQLVEDLQYQYEERLEEFEEEES